MRAETLTQRILTQFGALYARASVLDGRVVEVRFSHPRRFSHMAKGCVLDAMHDAVTDVIADLQQHA